MAKFTHVFVTVPEGREVPIPAQEGGVAGGGLLRCLPSEKGAPAKIYVVQWTTYTRKRITAGDLILVNRGGTKVKNPEDAAADASTKLEADGTVAKDQTPDHEINAKAKAAAGDKFDTSDAKGKA